MINLFLLSVRKILVGWDHKIRRMCEALGYQVKDLVRTRIMNIELGNLKEGAVRRLTDEELNLLYEQIRQSSNEPVRVWE